MSEGGRLLNEGAFASAAQISHPAITRTFGAHLPRSSKRVSESRDEDLHITRLRRTLEQSLQQSAALLNELSDAQRALSDARLLVREVDHRAKNSLQMAAAMLGLQARRTDDDAIRAQLCSAERRLLNLAGIHAALHADGDAEGLSVRAWLERVVLAFEISDHIAVYVEAPEAEWPAPVVRTLGLFASEAIANALKYAFAQDGVGSLSLRVEPAAEGYWRIEVADDGAGSPDSITEGLGCRLLRTFGRQLGGEVRFMSGPHGRGVAVSMVFLPYGETEASMP